MKLYYGSENLQPALTKYLYVCVCVSIHVLCMRVEIRRQPLVSDLTSHKVSCLPLCRSGLLVGKLLGSSPELASRFIYTRGHYGIQYYMGYGDLNSGPHVGSASSLPSELPHQPSAIFIQYLKVRPTGKDSSEIMFLYNKFYLT